jgi:hypothetical protein
METAVCELAVDFVVERGLEVLRLAVLVMASCLFVLAHGVLSVE